MNHWIMALSIVLMMIGMVLLAWKRVDSMRNRVLRVLHRSNHYAHARVCLRHPEELRNPHLRFVMDTTLWQIKEQMANLEGEIRAEGNLVAEMSANPASKMADVRAKQEHLKELRERHEILKGQHNQMEAEQVATMRRSSTNPQAEMNMRTAAGMFYRTAIRQGNVRELPEMAYTHLGAIPATDPDQGNGSRLLPTNLSNELLLQPLVENPLAAIMPRTQITGLEIAPLDFELEDDDFVADGETAKELKVLAGEHITFGRNELRLVASVSDTVLNGSTLAVEASVRNALQSKLALKELKAMFAESPAAAAAHMSFYAKGIKEITGANMLEAILNAYGDLEDFYRPNARCVMRGQDYFKMIRDMNGSENFFGKKPEDVIGIPVLFCERAVYPVVGNFQFAQENFDVPGTYDTEREARKGMNHFVVANWFDIQIKLAAAFRVVKPDEVATVKTPDRRLKTLTIGTLVLSPVFNSDVLSYTATTANDTDVITAVAYDSEATVAIKNGSTAVTSGQAATWAAGANAVTVTVTKSGVARTYKVKVTKTAA